MANNYKHYLKDVSKEVLLLENLRDSYLWSELYRHGKEFFWTVICLIVRLLVLSVAPVSVPLLAYASMKAEQRVSKRRAMAVAKIQERYK